MLAAFRATGEAALAATTGVTTSHCKALLNSVV